jgi:hypothetical protein
MVRARARRRIALVRWTDLLPEGAMYLPDDLLKFLREHRDELTLSVYIEAAPTDPAERRNWRVRLRQGIADVRDTLASAPADEQDAFERCAADVLQRLPNGDTPPATHGWVCFTTAGGDAFATHLADATETNVAWGPGARVVPFLLHLTEGRAMIVRIDREHARIQRWNDGVLEPLATLKAERVRDVGTHMGDSPARGYHSGTRGRTGTDEEQRQKLEATERLMNDTRDRLIELLEAHEPLLIGGASGAEKHLLESLPDRIAARATIVPALTMALADGPALPVIHEALVAFDDRIRHQRVTELREMAHTRGRAAFGYEPARAAAELGAIAELIFSERAWRQHPDEVESLVQRALFEGASVVLAPATPGAPLDGDAEGIIAGLRFPIPAAR